MSLDTAQEIIRKEVLQRNDNNDNYRIKLELFGGEPLLRFNFIKELSSWIWAQDFSSYIAVFVTSNGTLLDDEKQQWFYDNRMRIQLILSVDGSESMQKVNRGCDLNNIPIEFFRETWPNSYLKSTISKKTISNFADGIIYLLNSGYKVSANIAVGEEWSDADVVAYEKGLEKIANYYLTHEEIEPMPIFRKIYSGILESQTNTMRCGAGKTLIVYDINGDAFPCHYFLPISLGHTELKKREEWLNISKIDKTCKSCKIFSICKPCYGNNYARFHAFGKWDKSSCNMQLVQAKVITAFQVKYYLQICKKRELTNNELYALDVAVNCYEYCSKIDKIK